MKLFKWISKVSHYMKWVNVLRDTLEAFKTSAKQNGLVKEEIDSE